MTPGFTDGDPLKEFFVFLLVLAVAIILAAIPQVSKWLSAATARLADFIRSRGAFPDQQVQTSLRFTDLSRIAVGFLACWRYGEILNLAVSIGDSQSTLISGFATACAFLVMIGLATPIAALALMATSNLLVDNMLGASTLGTMVMAMVMAMFLLMPAGRTLSLDALLVRRTTFPGRWIGRMNGVLGDPSPDRVLVAKIAAVLAYYCLCLYSVSWHIHDDAWTSGLAIAWVFLSAGSNPHYADVAWDVYVWWPWLFVNFSRISIYGMMVWYVALLPGLFLGRLVRAFVILWGLSFFLISAFILPLSFLGFYELAFWFALFATGSIIGSQPGRALSAIFRRWAKPTNLGTEDTSSVPEAPTLATGRSSPLFNGMLVALIVLACAFLLRLPTFTTASDTQQPGRFSRELVGAAPLGFGIGPINVFNSVDMALFKIDFQEVRRDPSRDGEYLALTPDDKLRPLFHLTDRQRYFIIRHARRMSRMNISCDMQFWQDVAPMYVEALLPSERSDLDSPLIIHARLAPWPSAEELNSYSPSDRSFEPLCSAQIDVRTGAVKTLEYYQKGIDESAERNNWPALLSAEAVPAALGYSCRANAAWLNVIADSDQSIIADPSLLAGVRSLFEDRYGEFELNCLFRTIDVMKPHEAFKLDANPPPTSALCDAGVELSAILSANAGLPSPLASRLEALAAQASQARERTDIPACVAASSTARSDYFNYILKPLAIGDLTASAHHNVAPL